MKEGESIRVLTLLHDSDSSIHCQLHARKHKDELEYDALSYTWQGETPTTFINAISDNKIYKLPIMPNLEAALRQLRDPQEDRVFCIDAICINQDDKGKSQQVPIIGPNIQRGCERQDLVGKRRGK
jgi:hypothetical protein